MSISQPPWEYDEEHGQVIAPKEGRIWHAWPCVVADLPPHDYGMTSDNGRLTAAAPDMLAALLAVVQFIEGRPDAVEPFDKVRAAIAKATGEQQ